MKRSMVRVLAAGTVLAGATIAVPASSQAAARDGACNTGEFCLYYNSNQAGSVSDFTTSISDYGSKQPSCYEFKGAGKGKGICVKNNAASVWNRTGKTVYVCYNSGYGGAKQAIAAGAKANLSSALKNENAGHSIGRPPTSTTMSFGLYRALGGWITCNYNGYVNTPGKHEGIDFKRKIGAPVYALLPGKVISVKEGYRGRAGLSTIAVYNSTYNKTVVYLHADPTITVGATVTKGQKIAVEDWRGISSSSSAHTHVELRPGKKYSAAKSVNDYRLDNPDPRPFWKARGYTIK